MMKNRWKRLIACCLAFCVLLTLPACSRNSGSEQQTDTADTTVYVPTFSDCTLPVDSVSTTCSDGQTMYFAGQTDDGEAVTSGDDSVAITTRTAIFHMDMETGSIEELQNYTPIAAPESSEYYRYINSIAVGGDNTIWVTEEMDVYVFDLPENFDSETDSEYNYLTDVVTTQKLRQLDSSGAELSCLDYSDITQQLGIDSINSIAVSRNGSLVVSTDSRIYVTDSQLHTLFTLDGENLWGQLILLNDGNLGIYVYDDNGNQSLRTIDLTAKAWGADYTLPNYYSIYPGSGDYLFYYDTGDSVFGYCASEGTGEKLFSWSAADIDYSQLQGFAFLPDGRVSALLLKSGYDAQGYEMALLTPAKTSELPEKTVLTFATLSLDYDIRTRIINFNKHSDQYRIEIRDYSEYNTGDDTSAGLTKLNTEIMAGNVPDILDASYGNLPLQTYAAKGVLEDLWPFIENDPDLGREGVMEHVFQAAEIGGKLYQVFGSFDINTVIGSPNVVGTGTSWTLAQLREALASMPEGCQIFDEYTTQSAMLNTLLFMNLNRFVNRADGTCSFSSQDFISLLEFCGSFPSKVDDEIEYESTYSRIASGKQMLQTASIYNFTDIQMYKAMFGGSVTFIGYPTETGSGSSFSIDSGLALSSSCTEKEVAWSFIRQILLADKDTYYNFPTNRTAFEALAKENMTPEYQTDENGNQVLDENGQPVEISKGSWYWDELEIELKAASQDDYDQIMALYNSVDTISSYEYDESLFQIIQDEAAAYFHGDKTAAQVAENIQNRAQLYIAEQM